MWRFLTEFFRNIGEIMLQLFSFKKHLIHNLLSIYIKTTSGSTLCIDIDPKCDIFEVKKLVAPKIGLKPEELKVILAGKELGNDVVIEECDLGQQSILHVVKVKPQKIGIKNINNSSLLMPLCETLDDSMFSTSSSSENGNNNLELNESNNVERQPAKKKLHFYVYCSTCKALKQGKLRVRCNFCKSGAFTVHSDPQNWQHVLEPKQLTGTCENDKEFCEDLLQNREPTFAEFYFKCTEHVSLGENDQAVPLDLIRPNLKQINCLACYEISDLIFVFPCQINNDHVTCLECFKNYCTTKLVERQFWQHPEYGYTLLCPNGCADSFIKEIHHFRLLDDNNYERYHRFATEEYVLQSDGLLCPQPGCGAGILPDDRDCRRITCHECKYVFCRNCLQGFHIGDECDPLVEENSNSTINCDKNDLSCSRDKDEISSRTTIKVITKPCPSCKTPTERDGGCMHMICTKTGCKFHWCWVCQTEWTRECMGDHWFG